jgi:hypothetical protein
MNKGPLAGVRFAPYHLHGRRKRTLAPLGPRGAGGRAQGRNGPHENQRALAKGQKAYALIKASDVMIGID